MNTFNLRFRVLAAAVAGFALTPLAQAGTDVSIYGVADVYVAYQKGDRSEFKVDSGGLSGSRLGFNASHDLAGGLKVLGKFEAGVGADSGDATQGGKVWGRQTWVGLSGGFGTVTLGRQYTPTFNALDNDDPFETGAGSAISSGIVSIVGGSRANNSVAWELPAFGAVKVNMMYAAGEPGTGSSSNNAFYGAGLRYASGPLGVGLTVARQNRADDTGANAGSALLAGTYDFGAVSLMGGVQVVRNATRAANVEDNRNEYFVGVHVPLGNDELWVGAGSSSTKNVDGSRATQGSLGYLHALDKSTTLYAVATTIRNGDNTAFTTDTATGAGAAVSAGRNASALQMGLRYKF